LVDHNSTLVVQDNIAFESAWVEDSSNLVSVGNRALIGRAKANLNIKHLKFFT
jgi:hypothetical protein